MATPAVLLRERKTLATKIQQTKQELVSAAFVKDTDVKTLVRNQEGKLVKVEDPQPSKEDPNDVLERLQELLGKLRTTKVISLQTSVNTRVRISDELLGVLQDIDLKVSPEISLYEAVLLRDDLKSIRALLEQVIKADEYERTELLSPYGDNPQSVLRYLKYNFDVDEWREMSENCQICIDGLDALVQFNDATIQCPQG